MGFALFLFLFFILKNTVTNSKVVACHSFDTAYFMLNELQTINHGKRIYNLFHDYNCMCTTTTTRQSFVWKDLMKLYMSILILFMKNESRPEMKAFFVYRL